MRVALMLAALSIAGPGLRAQGLVSRPLDPGVHIRIHYRAGGMRTGRLAEPFGPDSSVLRYRVPVRVNEHVLDSPDLQQTPSWEVRRLEVRGRTRALEGALLGAAAGVAFGLLAHRVLEPHCVTECTGSAAVVIGVGAGTAAVGALVGAQTSVWTRAP